jgi:hypothetical protein
MTSIAADPPAPDDRKTEPALFAIVYVSTAAWPVQWQELEQILNSARRRNAAEGVTGLLLFAGGSFMQYLEGPAAGLSRVYTLIKSHPMHYGLIDLVRAPIATRLFADFAMACHVVEPATGARLSGATSPAQQDHLLAQRLAAADAGASAAGELLTQFWLRGRGSMPSALQQRSRAHARQGLRAHADRASVDDA